MKHKKICLQSCKNMSHIEGGKKKSRLVIAEQQRYSTEYLKPFRQQKFPFQHLHNTFKSIKIATILFYKVVKPMNVNS